MPLWRRLVLLLAVVLLLAFGWQGITGGVAEIPQSDTPGKLAQSIAQLAYGLSAILLFTSVRMPGLARYARIGWLVFLTLAGGLAPVVWGGTGPWPGLVAALGAFAIGYAVLWILALGLGQRLSLRGPVA